jgi:hypothetical protein
LDTFDNFVGKEFETTLDQNFFCERVTDLNGWALSRPTLVEGFTGQNRRPTDSIPTCSGPEQDHLVASALSAGEMEIFVAQYSHRECIDERVLLVDRVEPGFPANIGQPEAISVKTNPTYNARCDPGGVGMVEITKT